jgi:hypothetical protein
VVRPSGFEPPTFCSGGNAARRNWLFSRLSTQQLNRFSVYPPEKLLGKLLGGVPFTVLVREQRLEAWMIGERGYIAALSNAFDNPSRRAWRKRTPGKHSRNFLRPRGVNPKIETRKLGTLFIKRKEVENA